MKLKRFLLRYYPSGIVLEFCRKSGDIETKSIDLLNLTPDTDIDVLIDQIIAEEPLITENKRPTLQKLIQVSYIEFLFALVYNSYRATYPWFSFGLRIL